MSNYQEHKKNCICLMEGCHDPADEAVFADLSGYFNTKKRVGVVIIEAQELWVAIYERSIEAIFISK